MFAALSRTGQAGGTSFTPIYVGGFEARAGDRRLRGPRARAAVGSSERAQRRPGGWRTGYNRGVMMDLAPGWRVRCLRCGLSIPAGQAGIIRLGAYGKSYKLGWCQRCRRIRCFVVERSKRPAAESDRADSE